MIPESEKYRKVLNILRKSKPSFNRSEDIEEQVLNRIGRMNKKRRPPFDVVDYLFGWVYIGWVRRSLIAASVVVVLFFIYQQTVILKQVKSLSRQTIVFGNETFPSSASEIEKRLMLYKISDQWASDGVLKISEKQMVQLLDSYNELQGRYKNLIRLIEQDPELKKSVEKKLNEIKQKSNL